MLLGISETRRRTFRFATVGLLTARSPVDLRSEERSKEFELHGPQVKIWFP